MRKTTVAAWAQAHHPWLLIPTIGGAIGLVAVLQPALVLYSALVLAALGAPALLAWLLVRAPEILFALYMSIGSFKAGLLPLQHRLGVDLTVAMAFLVIAGITVRVLRKGGRIRLHWFMLCVYLLLVGWMCFSTLWSPAQAYGWEKSARFATLTLLAFAAPMLLIDTWSRLERFFWTLFFVGMFFTTGALIGLYLTGELQRLVNVFGADYLTLGHVCGLTAGLGAYFLISPRTQRWLRFLLLARVVASLVVVLLGAARGPMLAWLLAFVPPTLLGRRWSRQSFLVLRILLVGALLFAGSWVLGLLPQDVTGRFELLFAAFFQGDPNVVQFVPRIHIWQVGLDTFLRHPVFGIGAGGYFTSVRGGEIIYPHNLFLEAGAELGIVGLGLILLLITIPLIRWRKCSGMRLSSHHRLLFNLALWVYSYFFIEVMKSGDFNSNRTFWMSIGIVMSACTILTREFRTRAAASGAPTDQECTVALGVPETL